MDYSVIMSKRKTLALSVSPSGEVVVRAPYGTSEETVLYFLARHERWLERRLAERRILPRFADGDEVSIAGKRYLVASGARARISGEILFLPAEGREEALIALLKRYTRARMKELLDALCAKYSFSYTGLRVTGARGRWGSCGTNGHISFTFRTAFLPDELAYYLAVHELCHTRNMNHGENFWRDVSAVCPDWKKRRRALKGYLWAMDCL